MICKKTSICLAVVLSLSSAWSATGRMEERKLLCHTQEVTNIPPHGVVPLLDVPTGAGEVVLVQLAVISTAGSHQQRSVLQYDSLLQIRANHVDPPGEVIDVGTFFLTHGASHPFASDDFAITLVDDENLRFGAYRRISIPFQDGMVIDLVNPSAEASGSVYSQVYYYEGAPPEDAGGRRSSFHVAWTNDVPVSPYNRIQLLNVAGRGQIEGVNLYVHGPTGGSPNFLEGDMVYTVDGHQDIHAGGTEDFFGGQYYWEQLQFQTGSWGLIQAGTLVRGGPDRAWAMYRIHERDPVNFNSRVQLTWQNGEPGQSIVTPPTMWVRAAVFYYLDH